MVDGRYEEVIARGIFLNVVGEGAINANTAVYIWTGLKVRVQVYDQRTVGAGPCLIDASAGGRPIGAISRVYKDPQVVTNLRLACIDTHRAISEHVWVAGAGRHDRVPIQVDRL